ncbi:hypothetical protein RPMA_02315 [Tardiphaga alba]|uniref:Uncharacterized protein n=1 Tax=Tardiphaga alba TaxID=340268 RepID=A0ABX8A4B7_9BRAD|nr:hypothetical protein [Tardiphaga alba]QUS37826.1 hypothetical protein RPMA_02315 [Tardiphaga alba]
MRKIPPRVAARPDPAAWSETEVLTLAEAAALFFPQGPLSESSLRHAYRNRILETTMIARKLLTTKRAILAMADVARQSREPSPGD